MLDNYIIKTINLNMKKMIMSFPNYYELVDGNETFNYFFKTNYYLGYPKNAKGIYIYDEDDKYIICEKERFYWDEENKVFDNLDDLYYYFLTSMISDIASCYGIRNRKKYGDARIGCQIVSLEIMNVFEDYRDRFIEETLRWMEKENNIDWEPVYTFVRRINN